MRPTPYGWVVVFLMVWIPLTALFTANNFLLIVFIMMAGLVVVSHRLAKRNVASVSFTRQFPDEVFADTIFSIHYRVKSPGLRWGSVTVTLQEQPPLEGAGEGVSLYRIPADGADFLGMFTIARRGDQTIGPGYLISSFPFGLATYWHEYGTEETLVVFPKIEPVDDQIPTELGSRGRGLERPDLFGTVPYQLREYIPGDPYKLIEWKKSAQTGSLMTKILSEDGARDIMIRLPGGASEQAISMAASLVVHFGSKRTAVGLQGPGILVEPGQGKAFTTRLLTILARWDNSTAAAEVASTSYGALIEIDGSGELTWIRPGDYHDS